MVTQRILHLPVFCLAAGVAGACSTETVIGTVTPPTAGVRFVHAVPDTGSMDFRFVDIPENSAHYGFTFRATANLYYKGAEAGQRHLRIFMSGTTADVATIVVKDTLVNLEAGKLYTYILWGGARPGSTPPMQLTVLEDGTTDPGSQVALRVINAAAGLGPLDVFQYVRGTATGSSCPGGGTVPATPTFAGVAELTASSYVLVAAGRICFRVTPPGGAALFTDALAPQGTAATIDIEAIPGTNVAGSAVTGIVVPRSVAGSQAASFATPGIIFAWDRRPPR